MPEQLDNISRFRVTIAEAEWLIRLNAVRTNMPSPLPEWSPASQVFEKRACHTVLFAHDRNNRGAKKQYPFTPIPDVDTDPLFQDKLNEEGLQKIGTSSHLTISLFPWYRMNYLIIPLETSPQMMTIAFLEEIAQIARANREFFVSYSSWGAGATKNGLHAHIGPKELIDKYGFISSLKGHSHELGSSNTEKAMQIIGQLQTSENGRPFNVLILGENLYIVPRKSTVYQISDTPIQPQGVLEMLGIFVVVDDKAYKIMTDQSAEYILRECLLDI